jgi:hypothetical protein
MGRKRLRLIDDPDRYEIVLIDALIALQRDTEHACAKYITRLLIGEKGEVDRTRRGSNSGTIAGWRHFVQNVGDTTLPPTYIGAR